MRTQQFEIYITTNTVNGKRYIGLHSKQDESYFGSGTLLLKAISKYGRDSFTKEVIDTTTDIVTANKLERYYIEKYNAVTDDMFYNLSYGGELIAGRKHSTATIEKIKNSKRRNYVNNDELRFKVGSANRGKSMPDSTKNALLGYLTGHKCDEMTRAKISKSACKRYDTQGAPYPELINEVTGEILPAGTNITRLAKQIGVRKGNLHSMLVGTRKSCSGWRIK